MWSESTEPTHRMNRRRWGKTHHRSLQLPWHAAGLLQPRQPLRQILLVQLPATRTLAIECCALWRRSNRVFHCETTGGKRLLGAVAGHLRSAAQFELRGGQSAEHGRAHDEEHHGGGYGVGHDHTPGGDLPLGRWSVDMDTGCTTRRQGCRATNEQLRQTHVATWRGQVMELGFNRNDTLVKYLKARRRDHHRVRVRRQWNLILPNYSCGWLPKL